MVKIITGYTGERHITPAMDAAVYRSIFGPDSYILRESGNVAASMPDINSFVVADGMVSIQGRQVQIKQETLSIDTCPSAKKRIDLVAVRYAHDSGSQIDSAALVVIKGTEVDAANDPSVPTYNSGSLDEGATVVDFPLYRIDMAGSTVTFSLFASRIDVAMFDMLIPDGAGAHNGIYRGKYLGDSVTADQWAEIKAGRFHGMFIGDYWTIGSVNWRIAAFDYWLNYGDTACTAHHIVIVPDTCLYDAKMNDSNVTTGAYVGSKMYTTNLATAITTINNAFGSGHILEHKEYLKNAVTNGYESGGAWYARKVDLMTEEMVYGTKEFKNIINGTSFPAGYTIDHGQLPLFALDHSRICNRSDWWLRDVTASTHFAYVRHYGYCNADTASTSLGVRPAFGIYQS